MVEFIFIGLAVEVLAILFLAQIRIRAAYLFGKVSKEQYHQSRKEKTGLSKFKKGTIIFYIALSIFIFIGTGFSLQWHSEKNINKWKLGEIGGQESLINEVSQNYMEEKDICDMCIGISQFQRTYFVCMSQSPINNSATLDNSSVFEIGSITKTFTYAAMLKTLNNHNIEIDSPIADYLPKNIMQLNPNIGNITWQQLATHTSGLSRMPMGWDLVTAKSLFEMCTLGNPYEGFTTEYIYDYLLSTDIEKADKELGSYSNLAVGLLGLLLSEVENKSYPQLIADYITSPLNMTSTTVNLPTKKDKMVNGYGQYRRLGSLVVSAQSAPSIFSNGLAGAGAIRSSTKDMMIYLKNSMKDYKNSVFQEAKYTSRLSEKGKVNLGWIVVDMPGKLGESIIAHDGATGGFRSYLGFVESEDIGVIILTNGTRSVTSLGKNILQILAKESKKSASVANL